MRPLLNQFVKAPTTLNLRYIGDIECGTSGLERRQHLPRTFQVMGYAVVPIFRRILGLDTASDTLGVAGGQGLINSAMPSSTPSKTAHWLAFSGALSALLIIFAVTLSVLEWRKQEADARKELQSIAEIGARAVDTYFDVLQRSLRGLVDTLPEVRQQDIDSAE